MNKITIYMQTLLTEMNVDVVKPKVTFDRLITTIIEIFGCCATSIFVPSIDIAVPPLQINTQFKRHSHNIRVRYAACKR